MTAQFLLVCAALVGQASPANPGDGGLKWQTDLAATQRLARASGRIVLIHFGGPWCEPCRRLEQNVFSQPGFGRDLATRYVAVKIDPRQQHELAKEYGVRAVPCDVVTTPSGQLVIRLESPDTAAAYSATLNRVADNVLGPAPGPAQTAGANVAATTPPTQPTAAQPGSPDRYADYNNQRRPPPAAAGNTPPAAHQNPAPPAVAGESHESPSAAAVAAANTTPASTAPPATDAQHPPFALDRFCAVTLVEKRRWAKGSEQWGAIHRGRTYLFISAEAQKAFLANPDRYSPACAGNDPVLRVEHHQDVPGKREHGAFYNNRIYLFSSEDTFQRFDRNPARYTADVSRPTQRR